MYIYIYKYIYIYIYITHILPMIRNIRERLLTPGRATYGGPEGSRPFYIRGRVWCAGAPSGDTQMHMYVCMCIHIYIYIYVYMHTHTYACT